MGGDEFVAVLLDLDDVAEPACRCSTACWRPRRAVRGGRPVPAGFGQPGRHLLSAGGGVDADQLLRQADQAMYQAKLAGKNRYHSSTPTRIAACAATTKAWSASARR
jgi:GGDEF domain-containing protein